MCTLLEPLIVENPGVIQLILDSDWPCFYYSFNPKIKPDDKKFSNDNFGFYGQNSKVKPFVGKLLSSTLLFVYLFYPVCNFGKIINSGFGTVTFKGLNFNTTK